MQFLNVQSFQYVKPKRDKIKRPVDYEKVLHNITDGFAVHSTRARALSSELSVPRGVRAKTFSADQALARRESTLAFVRIADGYTADDLTAAGIDVISVRGQIAIADIPYDRA